MRGVTPVVSIVILLIVVLGITGTSYVFIQGVFQGAIPDDPQDLIASIFDTDDPEPLGQVPACADGEDNDDDGLVDWGYAAGNDNGCHSGFDDTEQVDELAQIQWDEFPEFHLNDKFLLNYYGIRIFDESFALAPLDHGFTHVYMVSTTPTGRDAQDVSSRATIWTGISNPCGSQGMCPPEYAEQPWEEIESPWENNLSVYREFWGKRIEFFASLYSDSVNSSFPSVDMISPDIEQKIDNWNNPISNDERIVSILKDHPLVPPDINALPDDAFIDRYKRDMAALYYEPAKFLRDLGFTGKISGYADVPIERAWHGIDDFTWEQWTTNWSMVNYAVLNFSNNGSGFYQEFGPYYYEQEFVSPSAYYFYDYPSIGSDLDKSNDTNRWNSAARYLAYHLFQAEVNENWIQISGEEKPILLWQWLNYHGATDGMDIPIRPHMAHASAIFPYFSGASGVHLWKTPAAYINSPKHISKYHDYVHGLYRLSEYNDFFDGDYEVYIPESAYSLFVNRAPVWRGIVNEQGTQMLVAAHDPFNALNEATTIDVIYNGAYLGNVTLQGLETYLGVFDIVYACSDGIDNDNDGLIDMVDSGCFGPLDNTENSFVSWFHNHELDKTTLPIIGATNFVTHLIISNIDFGRFAYSGMYGDIPGKVQAARDNGLAPIWERNLWFCHGNASNTPFAQPFLDNYTDGSIFFSADYYEAVLKELHREAELYGADLVAVDTEPYCLRDPPWTSPDFGEIIMNESFDWAGVKAAINEALSRPGVKRADYVFPMGLRNTNPNGYDALTAMANYNITETTYSNCYTPSGAALAWSLTRPDTNILGIWGTSDVQCHRDGPSCYLPSYNRSCTLYNTNYSKWSAEHIFEMVDYWYNVDKGLMIYTTNAESTTFAIDLRDYCITNRAICDQYR